jgi:hypothetical protein
LADVFAIIADAEPVTAISDIVSRRQIAIQINWLFHAEFSPLTLLLPLPVFNIFGVDAAITRR